MTCTIQGESSSGRAFTYAQDTTGGASKGTAHLNDHQLEVQECNFINLQPQQTEEDGPTVGTPYYVTRLADEWMDNSRSSFEALSTTLPIRHPLELMSSLLLVFCTEELGRTVHTLKWVRAK